MTNKINPVDLRIATKRLKEQVDKSLWRYIERKGLVSEKLIQKKKYLRQIITRKLKKFHRDFGVQLRISQLEVQPYDIYVAIGRPRIGRPSR